MRPAVWLWSARVAWLVLPVTAGTAFADAIDGWSDGPRVCAVVLLWIAWSAGLLALLAPRPWGCTLLRVVAPVSVACAIASAWSTSEDAAALAIASTTVAAALVCSAPVVAAAGNALAYGEEQRFPLRIPTPLLLGPVPLAIAVIAIGIASGPLLLADANLVAGLPCLIAGLALAWFLARSLHVLSQRWLVVVPAGLTFVDPLTLAEPVLAQRADIASVQRIPGAPAGGDTLDLRVGTVAGGVVVALAGSVSFARRRGRARAQLVEPAAVAVALARPAALLALASRRRITTR